MENTRDNHIYYHLGLAFEAQGKRKEAEAGFEKAVIGTDEPAGVTYYNDQPADIEPSHLMCGIYSKWI